MASSKAIIEPNQSLDDAISRSGPLPVRDALEITVDVARQVAQLHKESNRIHGAIGLATIQSDSQGRIQLFESAQTASFGGSDFDAEVCPPELQTKEAVLLPTVLDEAEAALRDAGLAMAPHRVDIYQLGTLLCRLVTGQPVSAYLSSPRAKAGVPSDIQSLIDGALGYDAEARFTSVVEVLSAIEQSCVDLGVQATLPKSDQQSTDSPSELENGAEPESKRDTSPSIAVAESQPDTDVGPPRGVSRPLEGDLPFATLGHFRIIGRIGHGGMGDVYKGYEEALDRTVAIKVLPSELAREEDFVRRFRAEATAVAQITHPNVVQIHFIGEDQGHHFFAMQYIEGESLADLLHRRGRLETQETLAILEQTLSGLAAAHKRGIVHRDIKPGNILLDRENRRALLADFGLVKAIESSAKMTATGVIMGTVDYIAPEQGRGQDVDARSDLYAIGVLTYQMLSGGLPFEADSPTAMIFQHVYEPPKPLRESAPAVPDPLCNVVHKLLAKSPDDRHQSAEDVLADLRAFRAGKLLPSVAGAAAVTADQPAVAPADRPRTMIIEARGLDEVPPLPTDLDREAPLGRWQRAKNRLRDRFQQHAPELANRLQNTQQQVDGAIIEYERRCEGLRSLVQEGEAVIQELRRQADEYREAAASAESRAESDQRKDDVREALEEKATCERSAEELDGQIAQQERELETMQFRLAKVNATLEKVRSQRDLLNARLKVAQAQIQLATGKPTRSLLAILVRVAIVAAVGTLIVSAVVFFWPSRRAVDSAKSRSGAEDSGDQKLEQFVETKGDLGELVVSMGAEPGCLAFTPTVTLHFGFGFATGNEDGSINLFGLNDDNEVRRGAHLLGHLEPINDIVFTPDGRWFATSAEDGAVRIWETWGDSRRKELRRLDGHGTATAALFSSDGSQILTASRDRNLRLWDITTGTNISTSRVGSARGWIQSMAWSRDGSRVLIGARVSGAQSMSLHNLFEDREELVFDTEKKRTSVVAFSRSEKHAYSLRSGKIYVNDLATGQLTREFGSNIRVAAFSSATDRVWSGDEDQVLALWDARNGKLVKSFSTDAGVIVRVALSVDGTKALSVSRDGPLRVWRLPPAPPPKNQLREFDVGRSVTSVAFSPDGEYALTNAGDDLALWNLVRGSMVRNYGAGLPVSSVAFSADGLYVLYGTGRSDSRIGGVALRDVSNRSWRDERQFKGHEGQVTAAVLSLDGRYVVSGSSDRTVRVWAAHTGQETERLELGAPINAVAISDSGDEILIAAADEIVRLWKWRLTKEVRQFEGHEAMVLGVAFSADGERAASASADRTVRIWNVETGQAIANLEGHTDRVNAVAFSSDGLTVLSGSDDTTVRLWDVTTAKTVQQFEGHLGAVRAVAISPGGTQAISGGDDKTLRLWKLPDSTQ